MVKGVAIVLIRILGLMFLTQGVLEGTYTVPYILTEPSYVDYGGLFYWFSKMFAGLFLLMFSRTVALLVIPVEPDTKADLNEDVLISAGTFLIGLYFFANGLIRILPEVTRLIMGFLVAIKVMSQHHAVPASDLITGNVLFDRYIQPWITGLSEIAIGIVLTVKNSNLAQLIKGRKA